MNLEIIKTKYPKAYEKLVVWSKPQLTATLGIAPELAEQFTSETLEIMLPAIAQSRALFDFFDLYNIFLNIQVVMDSDWRWNIGGTDSTIVFGNRRAAESDGFEWCFKTLEKKLS